MMSDPRPDPATAAQRAELAGELRLAMQTLPEGERDALALTYIGGLTHAEAAQALGMPVKTVSSHVSRGLERLRGRLGHKEGTLTSALAVMPAFAVPGGWESMLAAWKGAAFGALTPASVVATGGAVMANKGLWAAGLVLALGIGFGGGLAWDHVTTDAPEANPVADTARTPDAGRSATGVKRTPDAADDSDSEVLVAAQREAKQAKAENTKLRGELADARVARDEWKTKAETLDAELAPVRAERVEREPTFTFGQYGDIKGVRDSNWKELTAANHEVVACIREIREAQRNGEKPAQETMVRLQRNTEIVRKYEYETIGVIKSFARHNGELTYPLSMANLFAGELRTAGLPLSDEQRASIEALGLEFEHDWEAAQARFGNTTPRCEKLLDEYVLKGRFVDRLYDALTAEQRAHMVDPATFRVAFCDLHCPTLMLIHTSPIITGVDAAELKVKLQKMLSERYSIGDGQAETLQQLIDSWAADVATILTPVPQVEVRYYTYDQGTVALRATVKLVKGLRDLVTMDEEARTKLLDSYDVYIPRIVQ
jgi:hypothetical protein